LKQRGPLANLRVRQALNHAVHRQLIVEIAEHGHGRPQRSIATRETFGHADDIEPYAYNPDLARRILAEEGYADGFTLRGAVSETSTAVYLTVKEFLARVGVRMEADVMPRAEWMDAVRGPKQRGDEFDGDFALFVLDNPLLHSAFHQFVFLFSGGDWSLVKDAEYDRRFFEAATTTGEATEAALQSLEHYVAKNAMILFTVQASVHAAAKRGIRFPMPKSGHFDTAFWWNVDAAPVGHATSSRRPAPPAGPEAPVSEFSELLSATSHLGTLYLPSDATFAKADAARVWENLDATQQRWEAQLKPMIHELVTQVEAKTHLVNVLDSTERVAIYGIGDDGRRLFVNEGYRRMVGDAVSPLSAVGTAWSEIRRQVEERGVWSGPIHVEQSDGAKPTELYLTTTRARDAEQVPIGYTLVFSDFSGEEERIRNSATRAILDNVPYGLFRCGVDCAVLPGYSAACQDLLPGARTRAIEGVSFIELLGASGRDAAELAMAYQQIWDDFMPEEVSIGQFPRRIHVGDRAFGLALAPLRDDGGAIKSVFFSVFDESNEVAAERSQEHMRGLVNVLRHRDAFAAFVEEVLGTSARLISGYLDDSDEWQAEARRFVHTCKGVFGQFGLLHVARQLHTLEDADVFDRATVDEVCRLLREQLDDNRSLWQLDARSCAPSYAVGAEAFATLEEAMAAAPTLEGAREAARRWSEDQQRKPVGALIGPMASSCEQHAARLSKQVRFVLVGESVKLRAREWPLVGALAHAIRNAVDHGIEHPEDRGEKDPCGEISLAFEEGESTLCCRVRDDGRGIDGQKLVDKARRLGLLSEAQARDLSPRGALELVFAEGLSSAEVLSTTAGRGVGMGAVKAAVEELGGTVRISSELGRGTVLELSWPRDHKRVA
jgi:signal transduction histidine kinase